MTRDKTSQAPHPTDPAIDDVEAIDEAASHDADTEAHSMLTYELARAVESDRARETARMSRDAANLRDARPNRQGGLLKRFGRR